MLLDLGILTIRVLIGAAMAAHGAQKLAGWFGGYGLKGTGGFFEQLGFHPGTLFAGFAGVGEALGGLLLMLGLFTPAAAAMVLSAMLVAIAVVHWKNGFFTAESGIELPFLYAVAALALALTGPGSFSVDEWLGLSVLRESYVIGGFLLLSVLGAAATLAARRTSPVVASAAQH